MITISDDQMHAIEAAAYQRRCRTMEDELAQEFPDVANVADLVAQAQQDAGDFLFEEPAAIERYLRLLISLPAETLNSPWAARVTHVLTHTHHSASDRLDFIERYLIPRMLRPQQSDQRLQQDGLPG